MDPLFFNNKKDFGIRAQQEKCALPGAPLEKKYFRPTFVVKSRGLKNVRFFLPAENPPFPRYKCTQKWSVKNGEKPHFSKKILYIYSVKRGRP